MVLISAAVNPMADPCPNHSNLDIDLAYDWEYTLVHLDVKVR